MAKLLSREAILSAKDIKTEIVPVPEWGGEVAVRGLNGTERNFYEMSLVTRKGKDVEMNMKNATAKLVALTIVDEDGKPVFNGPDIEALGNKSGAALARVYKVAAKLSGLSDDDIKELTENLKKTPVEGSTTT